MCWFWGYFTWKQLQPETQERHYPVWHTLALGIPIYGLFRLHRHLSVIRGLAINANTASLNPGVGVALTLIANLVGLANILILQVSDIGLLILTGFSTALTTIVIVYAQASLNSVWRSRGPDSRILGTHWAESVLTMFGLLTWVFDFARI